MTQNSKYRDASRPLLAQASRELAAGDVRQASEKGWGAAAQMVKAIAEQRGWPHSSHEAIRRVVREVVRETGDREIFTLFHVAGDLHVNFYEDWETPDGIGAGLNDIALLLDKLEPLLE